MNSETPTYFDSPERRRDLRDEAARWLGTPFMAGCGQRARAGVCADCLFVAPVLQRCRAIGAVDWPRRYVSRLGGSAMLDLLLGIMDRIDGLVLVWDLGMAGKPQLLPGDLVVISKGTRLHHLVLVLPENRAIHSWDGRIQYTSTGSHREHIWRVYRPVGINQS